VVGGGDSGSGGSGGNLIRELTTAYHTVEAREGWTLEIIFHSSHSGSG
jgi:hypothetical protein